MIGPKPRRWLHLTLTLTAWLTAAGLAAPLGASERKAEEQAARTAGLADLEELKQMKFRLLGPAFGGRVTRVAGVPGNPNVYYAGAASGGIWKSIDAGETWSPIFDDQPIQTIGSLAVAPADPNVIYAGTGEANIRGNVQTGAGIWKSLDAGKSWTQVWNQRGQIGTMAVHPKNSDVAFAAVLGDPFGPNPERGVYRTRDGGRSWQQVLKKDADTGASDVALDVSNPNIVFAGLWQARRRPWEMTSGGPGSGLYQSRDGGDTWKQLTGKGLPEGIWGKVGVAVAPSDGRRVYALIEAEKGGLFRSDDGGESWISINSSHELSQRAWYYSTMTVSPANPDDVWFPQVTMLHSIDGGKTVQHVMSEHHGDNHDVWIDPRNPKRLIAGNDGGVDLSANGGETFTVPALPLGQFYHVSADNRVPFRVAGAMQDLGTAQGPSRTLNAGGIPNSDWYGVSGGEAGWVISDPTDPEIVYAGEYGGYISRYDHRTGTGRNVSIYPDDPSGHGGEDLRYRFQWTAPIALSPHDPKAIYHAANVLFRSTDGGQSWTRLSPDLTRDDKSKQHWSGGPITGDNTGVEIYCTIFVVAESPLAKGVIWAGSDDGLVHLTRDDGKTWSDVTRGLGGLPEWATIAMIEPSHFDAGTAYLVADAHRMDDARPYLWKTADYGRTWKRLDAALPQEVYLHTVREDPKQRGMLYIGSERGVAFSRDDGASWHSLKLNLPAVAVHDLVIKDDSLVLATHGRALWIYDELALLRALPSTPAAQAALATIGARTGGRRGERARAGASTASAAGGENALLPVPDAVRWSYGEVRPTRDWKGENAPQGASIYYLLRSAPKGEIAIDILDAKGTVVNTLSSKPKKPILGSEFVEQEQEALKKAALSKEPGIERAVWDLTFSAGEAIVGGKLDAGDPTQGPRALPGTYTVRLSIDGKTWTAPLRLLPDPRIKASEAELAEQLRLALAVRDAITRLARAENRLRGVRQQLTARNGLLSDLTRAKPLVEGSTQLLKKLDALEAKMQNPRAEIVYDILAQKGGAQLYSRLSPLLNWIAEGDGAPTQGMREAFAAETRELDADVAELERLLDTDLAALNASAAQLELPRVFVPEKK